MTIQEVANILAKGEKVVNDSFVVETDDIGRILLFKFNTKEKKAGRPNVLGLFLNGEFSWGEAAQNILADAQKPPAKHTIGSYVSSDEYELIAKAAALNGLSMGAFIRNLTVRAAKIMWDKQIVNGLETLDFIVK